MADPWCIDCKEKGIYTPALDVHHIKPWRRANTPEERERLAFDPDNTVCLCRDCHVKRHLKMNEETREKMEEEHYLKPVKSTFKRA